MNPGKNCLIIAEIGQAHDGSLGTAYALVDSAAKAGVHGVKFQIHLAASESTIEEPWRVPFSRQDSLRYDYWKRMQFEEAQWMELAAHVRKLGLIFVASPFSTDAVALGERIGVDVWKIASGEIGHAALIDAVIKTAKPVYVSTGMSNWEEIEGVTHKLKASGTDVTLLQCDTRYPSPPESWGLNVIEEMRVRCGARVGFSDHSGDIYAGLASVVYGAEVLEVHITLSKEAFGPDVSSSLTPCQLKMLVEGVNRIGAAMRTPVDKDANASSLAETRAKFSRSVALRVPLSAGTRLERHHLSLKKPAGGFPESALSELEGRILSQDVSPEVLLREEHLTPQER